MSRKGPRTDDVDALRLSKELQRERLETRKADLAWAMGNPRGRRLLFELLYDPSRGLGFDEATMTGNGSEAFAHNGRRAIAKQWVDRLKAELPDEYLEMLREHLESKQEAQRLRDTSVAGDHPEPSQE